MKNNRRNRKKVIMRVKSFKTTDQNPHPQGLVVIHQEICARINHKQAAFLIKKNPGNPLAGPIHLLMDLALLELEDTIKGPAIVTGIAIDFPISPMI